MIHGQPNFKMDTLYQKKNKNLNFVTKKKQQNYFWKNFPKIILPLPNTYLFFSCRDRPLVSQRLIIQALRSQTHHSWYDSSGRVTSPTQRPISDNTQHSQETDIHADRRDSNPQSQQAGGRRLMPLNTTGIGFVYLYRDIPSSIAER